jgi:protein-S-isoprenylcysteine O-methyltransferase Ste14
MKTFPGGRSDRIVIQRKIVPFLLIVGFAFGHVVLPQSLSSLSPRRGWRRGRPGPYNLLSLLVIAAGAAGVFWTMALHFIQSPQGWELERTPNYLLLHGPYKVSRNPMYLSELVLWLGWAAYYGSAAVLIGCLFLFAMFNFFGVPWEERVLEARFGDAYLQYKSKVPRWLLFRPHDAGYR